MKFHETRLAGVVLVELEPIEDERGFFARRWCAREFEAHGLTSRMVQTNVGMARRAGTVRGLHFQIEPHAETKLIWCARGALYSVAVDARPESATRGEWVGVRLAAEDGRMLFVPEGFAHGYQALADATEIGYQVSEFYVAEAERGIRPDDPALAIEWPLPIGLVSRKDRSWPDFAAADGRAAAGVAPSQGANVGTGILAADASALDGDGGRDVGA